MKARHFALEPFSLADRFPLNITGSIERVSDVLAVRYALSGLPADVVVPPPVELPVRRHGLWLETCFEFFLGPRKTPGYWEVNLSPAGHWNVFRFSEYRKDMQEEGAFAALPFAVERGAGSLTLALECSLEPIILPDQPLEVAVTAVMRHTNGRLSYWALAHPGPQPDFHRREGFTLRL